jgi:hypothetical protein
MPDSCDERELVPHALLIGRSGGKFRTSGEAARNEGRDRTLADLAWQHLPQPGSPALK